MIKELVEAFLLIFIAEMGDKTQVLAMAFALKYPVKKVLVGIGLGAFLNHALAVILGAYLSTLVDLNKLQIIAGLVFIAFGLLSIRPEDEDDDMDADKNTKRGAVLTVAIAFFIGELGDKTQLTAITLASNAAYPAFILMGTVLGMVVTGGLGIYIGKKFGERIPELVLKIVASFIFIGFGIAKLLKNMTEQYMSPLKISMFTFIIGVIYLILLRQNKVTRDLGTVSLFTKRSKELYYRKLKQDINRVCLGAEKCGGCDGKSCIVGYTKLLIDRSLSDYKDIDNDNIGKLKNNIVGTKNQDDALFSLLITILFLKEREDETGTAIDEIQRLRQNFEMMITGRYIQTYNNWKDYYNQLAKINKQMADKINNEVGLI